MDTSSMTEPLRRTRALVARLPTRTDERMLIRAEAPHQTGRKA